MLLLSARDIKVSFGARDVLDIEEFALSDGQRIGLVGENGAGKTTLLGILAGEAQGGQVKSYGDIAYVTQRSAGYDMSGGEETRTRIAEAFAQRASILLADEPTTNLDIEALSWLEKRLNAFRGGVVLVSHDRALMDAVCTHIAQLEDGKLTLYNGNFSDYMQIRQAKRDLQQFEYDEYRRETARLTKSMQGAKKSAGAVKKAPSRMGNSEARLHRRAAGEIAEKLEKRAGALQSRIEQIEKKQRPREDPDIRLAISPLQRPVSKSAFSARGLSISRYDRTILTNVDFDIPTGKRTVIMGPNGAGKSTLLDALLRGEAHTAPGLRAAVMEQDSSSLEDKDRIIQSVQRVSTRPRHLLHTVLARVGFRGDAVEKPIGVLSGGERMKVMLARALTCEQNALVFDEPTNSLDLYALEALEGMLSSYEGTLVMVTHDRALCSAVADRVLWVENGKITTYEHGYAQFIERFDKEQIDEEEMRRQMRLAQLAAQIQNASGEQRAQLENEYDILKRQ